MMKKKTPFLNYYKCWMRTGKMPAAGMCYSVRNAEMLDAIKLFRPTRNDAIEYRIVSPGWWGSLEAERYAAMKDKSFNEFRQTVILFCAAMNNEF